MTNSKVSVRVYDLNFNFIGYGWYVGNVTVYVIARREGKNLRITITEEKPKTESSDHETNIQMVTDEPKIILDNGAVVYGQMIWWEIDSEKSLIEALKQKEEKTK